jgi:hypothetical protein
MVSGQVFKFNQVFRKEISSINKKRTGATITLEEEAKDNHGDPILRPTKGSAVIGLALSGGGIRSSAFCLGSLQGLDLADVLHWVDYLSTVSGGGYIGGSLSAGMNNYDGKFPFETTLTQDETPSIQYIRDHSNYLFPNGPGDLLRNSAIYARGLLANALIILPFLLVTAAITILSNPTVAELSKPDIFGFGVTDVFGAFTMTWCITIVLLIVLFVWAIYRSVISAVYPSETDKIKSIGLIALALVIAAFCEMQPFVLNGMFEPASDWAKVYQFVRNAVTWLAPFAAIVGFLSQKIGEFVKSATESPLLRQQLLGWLSKAGIWVASALVPLILWAVYLKLSYWGIRGPSGASAPRWLQQAAEFAFGWTVGPIARLKETASPIAAWPGWTASPIAWLYLATGLVLGLVSLALQPNANSLHPLYRDRLSKAFLFKPRSGFTSPAHQEPARVDQDLKEQHIKLSKLSETLAP